MPERPEKSQTVSRLSTRNEYIKKLAKDHSIGSFRAIQEPK